jgi:hypothetical protein
MSAIKVCIGPQTSAAIRGWADGKIKGILGSDEELIGFKVLLRECAGKA